MQRKVEISQSRSCASHSASLAVGMSCADAVCFKGSCNDAASIPNVCVHAHECSIAELWTAAYFLCVCIYMFLYLVHHWDLNVGFSLVPGSGLSRKHILGCIINLFELWLLGGKLWKCWISLPFPAFSLPRMSSSEKLETLADFTARYVLAVSCTIVLSL